MEVHWMFFLFLLGASIFVVVWKWTWEEWGELLLFDLHLVFGKSSFEYTCLADKKRHHFLDIINGSIVVDDDILENDIVERTLVSLVVWNSVYSSWFRWWIFSAKERRKKRWKFLLNEWPPYRVFCLKKVRNKWMYHWNGVYLTPCW